MPVRGSPLGLSDEELEANAEVNPERDLPRARAWNEEHMPEPFDQLNLADEDPNDPATVNPDDEPTPN